MDYVKKKDLIMKNYITKAVLAGITIFLLAFCRQVHALNWSPPQAHAFDAEWGDDFDIAVDTNNNWHVVYSYHPENGDGDIGTSYIKYVNSTGAQGIIAQAIYYGDIYVGEYVSSPTIDADSNGGLHVIYVRQSLPSHTQTLMYTTANLDRDGDGLLDDWETEGIYFNDDRRIDLDLSALGADPNHKDLFVEVDAMVGRAPAAGTLDRVVNAFAAVPNALVNNPDGRDGITLHIQLDETNIPLADWSSFVDTDGDGQLDWVSEFDVEKNGHFGTPQQRSKPDDWTNIKAAKALVYRYCIFANKFVSPHVHPKTSGLAELPGNDFMVTLGAWSTAGDDPNQQAATFMHELGHTLNLRHGGDQYDPAPGMDYRYNFKPNYHSIMNYTWQMPHPAYASSWLLDYSRETLPELDESSLNEPIGIQGNASNIVPAGPLPALLVNENGPVNWNRDEDENDLGVAADINHVRATDPASPNDVLTGHNDWQNLRYQLWGHRNFQDGVHTETTIDKEMTLEIFQELSRIGCAPWDFNCDGSVDFDDFAILGNQWLNEPGFPSTDIAPGAGDGVVDFWDLTVFLEHWLESGI